MSLFAFLIAFSRLYVGVHYTTDVLEAMFTGTFISIFVVKMNNKYRILNKGEGMKEQIDTYCGLCCATCEYKKENNCKGCISSGGKPFHGECEIAECAKKKNIRFCGECSDFPCDILKKYS